MSSSPIPEPACCRQAGAKRKIGERILEIATSSKQKFERKMQVFEKKVARKKKVSYLCGVIVDEALFLFSMQISLVMKSFELKLSACPPVRLSACLYLVFLVIC